MMQVAMSILLLLTAALAVEPPSNAALRFDLVEADRPAAAGAPATRIYRVILAADGRLAGTLQVRCKQAAMVSASFDPAGPFAPAEAIARAAGNRLCG